MYHSSALSIEQVYHGCHSHRLRHSAQQKFIHDDYYHYWICYAVY